MLKRLKALQDVVAPHLERGTIPIPQDAINKILPLLVKSETKIESLQVTIRDGHFDVLVHARKVVAIDATVRFEVAEADVSLDRQAVRLRQIGRTDLKSRTVLGNVARLVLEATFLHMAKSDAAAYAASRHPSIQVEGDVYTVDLSTLSVWGRLQNQGISTFLRHGRIDDIICTPARFELVPHIDRAGLQQDVQHVAQHAMGHVLGSLRKRP